MYEAIQVIIFLLIHYHILFPMYFLDKPADIDMLEEFMYLANSGVFQQLDILPAGNTTAISK